jgi:hypothetical protein
MLDHFPIQGRIVTGNSFLGDVQRRSWRMVHSLLGHQVFSEATLAKRELPLSDKNSVILSGYFQSEKYFREYESAIRAELMPAVPSETSLLKLAQQLRSENSVSVHVRRGDYVSNPIARSHHGVCGEGYYRKAKIELESQVSAPRYVIFTDDIPWVKDSFGVFPGALIASELTHGDPVNDLWLMAQCRHAIIANSSFSWWGAWLGNFSGKSVFAPERWLLATGFNTEDLVPAAWKKVKE